MHWNEQPTSRNWRLDSIKFWSRWSELIKCIVYLLIAVLPAIVRLFSHLARVHVTQTIPTTTTMTTMQVTTLATITISIVSACTPYSRPIIDTMSISHSHRRTVTRSVLPFCENVFNTPLYSSNNSKQIKPVKTRNKQTNKTLTCMEGDS